MDTITKTISYTVADLQMAYDLHWRTKQPIRKNIYLIIAVVSFLLWLFVDYTCPAAAEPHYEFWLALKYFFLLYSIICVALHFWWFRTFAKRTAKKMKNLGKEFSITFSPTGIKAANDSASTDTLWAAYPEAIMNDQIILLYRNEVLFNYYPRRFFTGEEYQNIRDWIKESVKVMG